MNWRFVSRSARFAVWTNPTMATLIVFGMSGLDSRTRDFAAGRMGGYGLPTLYFVIQGVGHLLSRTQPLGADSVGTGRATNCRYWLARKLPALISRHWLLP